MATPENAYPARLDIAYPEERNRWTVFFRLILVIPILIILVLVTGAGSETVFTEAGQNMSSGGWGIVGGLAVATGLLILFRQRYPRWWFNFILEFTRFSTRVNAYLGLLTDLYPSTVDKQSVQLDIDYPNAKRDLNRWMPLVKWLLALPHYIVLGVLSIAALVVTIIAWFAILFTGQYPKGLFDFSVGVMRWELRVTAYTLLLTTDKYPPFSLK